MIDDIEPLICQVLTKTSGVKGFRREDDNDTEDDDSEHDNESE